MSKTFMLLAALLGGLGVAMGAFGAHALEARLSPRDLGIFETGVRYQLIHALALGLVSVGLETRPQSSGLWWAGWAFAAGTLIFSGSLYVLVLTQIRWLGAVTPIGGLAFLGGWLCLLVDTVRR
ncbi:MAG: DUF423 domain-containing protein [Myxococcota bacterium]